ncbi:MAG: hypothetical protein AB1491_10335 [Thermodesulfobacteriota bacterium]
MLIITGLVCNLIATGFLFFGSKAVPWDIQTIGGESEEEKKFKRNRQRFATNGFVLLFVGFLLQLIGTLAGR